MSNPNNKASKKNEPEPQSEPEAENNEVKEGAGKSIPTYKMMDKNNQKASDVLVSQGIDKDVEFMFKHPETGEKMDYATMRYYYG
jgi:hypothetical protein